LQVLARGDISAAYLILRVYQLQLRVSLGQRHIPETTTIGYSFVIVTFQQCCGSGSGLELDSKGYVDLYPDPDSYRIRIQEGKNDQTKMKKVDTFYFLNGLDVLF
jgi:hypothetical protein